MVVLKIYNLNENNTKEPISTFEVGEHVVGRGSFANCMDKRISRRHIVLNVNNNEATLTLIHATPIFFMSKNSSHIRIFNKNEYTILSDGDKFAFLIDTWYTVKIEENQSKNGVRVESTASATPISNTISSDIVVAPINKTIISQPTSCKRSADDLCSEKAKKIKLLNNNLENNSDKIVSLDDQNNTDDIKASPSEVVNNNTTEVFKIFGCISDSDDEDSDAEILPEVTCDTEVVNGVQNNADEHSQSGDKEDKDDNNKSSEILDDLKSEPMIDIDEMMKIEPQEATSLIGDDNTVEPKVEGLSDPVNNESGTAQTPEDNENTKMDRQDTADATASSSSTSVVNRLRREQCWYGQNCYRKNPGHRNQFSHPGDSDHGGNSDEDNRPDCPYGAQCYRTNPQHRQDFKHPTSRPASRPSTNNRRNRHRNVNTTNMDYDSDSLDEGDPFSADESSSASEVFEGGDSDSDYLEEPNFDDMDDSEEVKIMFKEAKKFLTKKR